MYELPLVKLIASRLNENRLRIQVVAGPRQVGKTTALCSSPLSGEGVNPLAVCEVI